MPLVRSSLSHFTSQFASSLSLSLCVRSTVVKTASEDIFKHQSASNQSIALATLDEKKGVHEGMGDEDIEAKGDSIERLKHLLTSGKLLYTSTKKYAAGGTTTGAAGGGSDVKAERFLPGRMCYVYNLKDGEVEESEEVEASTAMTTTSSMFDFINACTKSSAAIVIASALVIRGIST